MPKSTEILFRTKNGGRTYEGKRGNLIFELVDVRGVDDVDSIYIVKVQHMGKKFDQYHGALEDIPEVDYYQEMLDRRLRPIAGERFAAFTDRYKWIKKIFYR